MAAEQKAVESTAEEILQKEDHLMVKEEALETDHVVRSARAQREEASVTIQKERASATDHAAHLERVLKDHAEHSVTVRREEHSVTIQKEEALETDHADHLARVLRAEASVTDLVAHSVRVLTDHAAHSARAQREEAQVKEDHSATESQADSE